MAIQLIFVCLQLSWSSSAQDLGAASTGQGLAKEGRRCLLQRVGAGRESGGGGLPSKQCDPKSRDLKNGGGGRCPESYL